jgi:hypothetical protein
VRIVAAGTPCQSEPVRPDALALNELALGQYAMLTLAGLRTLGSSPA